MFDLDLAITGAALVEQAYLSQFPEDRYTLLQQFANGFGFILQDKINTNDIFIVIPGTKDVADILSDAEVIPKELPYGKVHSGFWEAFMDNVSMPVSKFAVRLASIEYVDIDKSKLRITVVGHSLGAAMAIYTALALRELEDQLKCKYPVYLIGIATPNPGNADFITTLHSKISLGYFIRSKNDVVPKVPYGFGYKSVSNDKNTIELHFDEVPPFDITGNHSITRYKKGLLALKATAPCYSGS